VLARRAFLALVGVVVVACGDAVTSAADFTKSVALGMRSALRSTVATVLEPTDGPWANQNAFGDQFFGPLPTNAGKVIEVLPKNTKLYGPPSVHSVALGRSDGVAAQNADVYARITIGCGGVENSFDCDWLHGAQLALVCNSVSVRAVTYAPHGDADYSAASAAVALKASVAKGNTSQGRCPATYTMPTQGLFGNLFFSVPDFAREFCLHVGSNNDPAVPTDVLVHFRNEGGTDLAAYNAQVFAGGRSIPLPGGTNAIFVDKLGASPLVTPQFFLGF